MPTETDSHTHPHTGEPRWRRIVVRLGATLRRRHERRDERGQATSEYALVILVAAGIAFGVIAWAGNTDAFTRLFDAVIDQLTSDL